MSIDTSLVVFVGIRASQLSDKQREKIETKYEGVIGDFIESGELGVEMDYMEMSHDIEDIYEETLIGRIVVDIYEGTVEEFGSTEYMSNMKSTIEDVENGIKLTPSIYTFIRK